MLASFFTVGFFRLALQQHNFPSRSATQPRNLIIRFFGFFLDSRARRSTIIYIVSRFLLVFVYTLSAVVGLFKSTAPDTQKNLSIEKTFCAAASDFGKCDFSNEPRAPLIQKLRRENRPDGTSAGDGYWVAQKIRLPKFGKTPPLSIGARNTSRFIPPNIRTYTVFLI